MAVPKREGRAHGHSCEGVARWHDSGEMLIRGEEPKMLCLSDPVSEGRRLNALALPGESSRVYPLLSCQKLSLCRAEGSNKGKAWRRGTQNGADGGGMAAGAGLGDAGPTRAGPSGVGPWRCPDAR